MQCCAAQCYFIYVKKDWVDEGKTYLSDLKRKNSDVWLTTMTGYWIGIGGVELHLEPNLQNLHPFYLTNWPLSILLSTHMR